MNKIIKECAAEAVGTFALVFAGTGAIIINDITGGAITNTGIGLTFGLVVMAMVYALGDISGAHINPAVTIGFYTTRSFSAKKLIPYIGAQITGALLASLSMRFLFSGHRTLGTTLPRYLAWQSAVLEFFLTFLLMFVILNVSQPGKNKKLISGIAIGATVGVEALFAGPICGASMNPARSLAPAIISGHFEYLWIYILAPVSGAIFGALLFSKLKEDS